MPFRCCVMRVLTGLLLGAGLGASSKPGWDIKLTPIADKKTNTIPGVNVSMLLHGTSFGKGESMLEMPLSEGFTTTPRYDGDAIQSWDGAGPLVLLKSDRKEDSNEWRTWSPERATNGDVHLSFYAPGRVTDKKTLLGPRIDFRLDQGGIIGKGRGFLPYPPKEEEWSVGLEWDLSDAPEGTSARWSVAGGLKAQAVGFPKEIVGNAHFAIGPLVEWPAKKTTTGDRLKSYWIGNPPWDMHDLSEKTSEVFGAIANHFEDHDSEFTVFVRRVFNGFGGTGGYKSFLWEYSDGMEKQETELDLTMFLAHEMVHEYALMVGEWESEADGWYTEGVANYLPHIILANAGILSLDKVLESLNWVTQGYYTSPLVTANMDDVLDNIWANVHVTRVVYNRGFMYLFQVNGMIAKATGGKKSLDDIIMELYRRLVAHEKATTKEFLELLGDIVGKEAARDSFDAMWRGDLIVPNDVVFPNYELELARRDCHPFELGFDPNSFRTFVVKDLQKGSRAELAGVKEGDAIVHGYMVTIVADGYDREMEMTVRRGADEVTLRWLPRAWDTVECWWWQEREHSDEL